MVNPVPSLVPGAPCYVELALKLIYVASVVTAEQIGSGKAALTPLSAHRRVPIRVDPRGEVKVLMTVTTHILTPTHNGLCVAPDSQLSRSAPDEKEAKKDGPNSRDGDTPETRHPADRCMKCHFPGLFSLAYFYPL